MNAKNNIHCTRSDIKPHCLSSIQHRRPAITDDQLHSPTIPRCQSDWEKGTDSRDRCRGLPVRQRASVEGGGPEGWSTMDYAPDYMARGQEDTKVCRSELRRLKYFEIGQL